MARNITNIFSLSLSIRQLMTISNNAIKPIRLFRSSSYCENARKREDNVYQSSDKRKLTSRNYSLMINRLRACSSLQEIFQLIKENNKNINGHEALEIMTTLFQLQKNKEVLHNNVPQTKEFSMLCQILKSNIRQLSAGDAIQALKVLNFFHVPTSSVIIQMVLQAIRNSMNNLSIDQILFLIFLLSKCQKTPLVEALSIALPIVLQSCIKTQLDTENIDVLAHLLQYLVHQPNKNESISNILNALNNLDISLFTPNHANVLLMNIANLNVDNAVSELVKKCQQILINSMSNMTIYDLGILHKILTEHYRYRDDLFYNEDFLETYTTAIISQDMGFDFAVKLLSRFNGFPYTNNSLLDYVATKCLESKNEADIINNKTMSILLHALSNTDYKPVFWDTIKKMIMNDRLLEHSPVQLISLSIYLASLDCIWPELLAKMFTTNYTNTLLPLKSKKKFLFVYSIVKTNYPEYTGPWPSDNLIQMFMSSLYSSSYNQPESELKSALECALGGHQYVMTNIRFNIGYYIDHVIIMRKGGFPIAINNTNEGIPPTIEELQPPENSQVILLIRIPYYGYVRNTQHLTGFWTLLIRALKTQTNYTVIPINSKMWENMNERDRVQYLSQTIRLKTDTLSAIVNT